MGRQGLKRVGPANLYASAGGSDRFGELYQGQSDTDPTPAEITDLATALGCPEDRLTVSREELERENERLRADPWRRREGRAVVITSTRCANYQQTKETI